MSFYTRIRDNVAAPAIRKYGQAATLVVRGEEFFDSTTGEVLYTQSTDDAGYALIEEYSIPQIDGTNIRIGDRKALCVDVAEPKPGVDKLKIGTIEYAIISVKPLAPGGVAVYYEVQIRG